MVDWSRLFSLVLFLVFFSVVGVVLWIVYSIMMGVKAEAKDRMKEYNVILSRKGVTVELQELSDEDYRDKQQR
jgi:ABC-type lipoprotein release transport system permease subunit